MGKRDPRVGTYIEKSAAFAKPILRFLRRAVHTGCPDVVETMKWSFPHFDYKGIFCGMAAFKAHATFGFWKGALLTDGKTSLGRSTEKAMGQFGRITSVKDLPTEARLIALVRRAAALNDQGARLPRKKPERGPRPLAVPAYFMAALRKRRRALATFERFSPGQKREYVEWVTEAKREDTRSRRLATAVAWMAEGKSRNWKYVRQ